jgi:hypothetical protein
MGNSSNNPYDLRDLKKDNESFSGVLTDKKNLSLWEYIQKRLNKRTELTVPHSDSELSFICPPIGGHYIRVGNKIDRKGLYKPTAAETVSLVYEAYQKREREFWKVREILKDNMSWLKLLSLLLPSPFSKGYCWLWMFTGNLYVPNEGVYIQDNPPVIDKEIHMKKEELVEKLESGDRSVRFVPFGFKIEEQTPSELEKNPYIVGLVGEEGAEKLAEIVEKYFKEFYVLNFNNVDNEIVRVSALESGLFKFRRLYLCCDCFGWGYGYAFGIDKMTGNSH